MITLGDVRDEAARYVDGGLCPDHPRVVQAINLATERLFYVRPGQHGQVEDVTLSACGCHFSLDYRYERLFGKTVTVNGRPVPIRGEGYELQEVGPGAIDCRDAGTLLIAEGQRAAYHPLDNKRVLIVPDSPQDEQGAVNLQGKDSSNREVVRERRGENVAISNSNPRFSRAEFRGELTSVTKPVTKGWVYGYAFDPETNFKQLLFAMHPLQKEARFSRYKLTGSCQCDAIVGKALKKWYPVCLDSDVLPVQSTAAIVDKVRAMEARDGKDPQAEAINNNSALSQLEARSNYGDHGADTLDVRISGGQFPSYGEVF